MPKLPINTEHHDIVRASLYYYKEYLTEQAKTIPVYIRTREVVVKELSRVSQLVDRIDRFYDKELAKT